ncbi:MAG: ATPase domain-containing protein [Candidatus Thorarchaeota archaeon]|nr:MAG: ATPase [Candidatus Thorarchaeota archaeon]RLI59142.1 MAG: ATPase [Candidatus Thorarchaeota archaeon]
MTEYEIERVKTGIPGLDELIEGGFPRGDTILVAGKAGTGKSILATQFIYRGATEYGEPGVFVTMEEPPHLIKRNMMRFGMDLDAMEKAGLISIVDLSPSKEVAPVTIGEYPSFDLSGLEAIIMNHIKKVKAKRVVIDTLSIMAYKFRSRDILREEFFKLTANITRTGCTLLLTSEIPAQDQGLGVFDIEAFLASGVIVLYNEKISDTSRSRSIEVLKLRGSKHSSRIHSMRITEEGIRVWPGEISSSH